MLIGLVVLVLMTETTGGPFVCEVPDNLDKTEARTSMRLYNASTDYCVGVFEDVSDVINALSDMLDILEPFITDACVSRTPQYSLNVSCDLGGNDFQIIDDEEQCIANIAETCNTLLPPTKKFKFWRIVGGQICYWKASELSNLVPTYVWTFTDEETSEPGMTAVSFRSVLIHELGHSIGMGHSAHWFECEGYPPTGGCPSCNSADELPTMSGGDAPICFGNGFEQPNLEGRQSLACADRTWIEKSYDCGVTDVKPQVDARIGINGDVEVRFWSSRADYCRFLTLDSATGEKTVLSGWTQPEEGPDPWIYRWSCKSPCSSVWVEFLEAEITIGPIEVDSPSVSQVALRVSPNPARAGDSISIFASDTTSEALHEVAVFSISGRLVEKWVLPSSEDVIVWTGLSQSGLQVPSGVYYISAYTYGGRRLGTSKLVLGR